MHLLLARLRHSRHAAPGPAAETSVGARGRRHTWGAGRTLSILIHTRTRTHHPGRAHRPGPARRPDPRGAGRPAPGAGAREPPPPARALRRPRLRPEAATPRSSSERSTPPPRPARGQPRPRPGRRGGRRTAPPPTPRTCRRPAARRRRRGRSARPHSGRRRPGIAFDATRRPNPASAPSRPPMWRMKPWTRRPSGQTRDPALEADVGHLVLGARVRAAVQVDPKRPGDVAHPPLEVLDQLRGPLLRLDDGELAELHPGARDDAAAERRRLGREADVAERRRGLVDLAVRARRAR